MGLIKEFKTFVMRGNVLDMAVGIIIGAAFGKIVSSLVADVMMPVIAAISGGDTFGGFSYPLKPAAGDVPALRLEYGKFLNTIVDFVIVAFAIFLLIKLVNTAQKKLERSKAVAEAIAPPPPTRSEVLLEEIRDLLRSGRSA